MMLEGKTALVVGVANKNSIAWAIADALRREGAKVVLTYQNERLERRVGGLAEECDPPLDTIPMDATNAGEVEAAFRRVGELCGGKLDILVHSIAFAKKEDLEGGVAETSAEGFKLAHEISAWTLLGLANAAKPLMEAAGGGSILTLTYYGGEKVMPNYNLMGICKASLEASVRYLAWEMGPSNIRVNAVSAGPIKTMAARGIAGFGEILDVVAERAPLKRNVTVEEVGSAGLFLLSPMAGGITGEVLHVDAGYNIMGM